MASSGQPHHHSPDSLSSTRLRLSDLHIGIVHAQWHSEIVEELVRGAVDELLAAGVSSAHIRHVVVPGSFELPIVASAWARSEAVHAVICLGVIVRGDTPHFDYVAGPVAHALQQIAISTEKPCAFGVLTTNTVEQAWERAGGIHGHKGREAAQVVLQTLRALDSIRP